MSIDIKILNQNNLEIGIAESIEFDKENNHLGILFISFPKIRINKAFAPILNSWNLNMKNCSIEIFQNEILSNRITYVDIFSPVNCITIGEYFIGTNVLAEYGHSDNYIDITSTNEWFKRIDNLKAFW